MLRTWSKRGITKTLKKTTVITPNPNVKPKIDMSRTSSTMDLTIYLVYIYTHNYKFIINYKLTILHLTQLRPICIHE